jgi:hypothetical protein
MSTNDMQNLVTVMVTSMHDSQAYVAKKLQLLQNKFYELHMKHDDDVVNHINTIEIKAHQLTNLRKPFLDQAIMTKVLWILP